MTVISPPAAESGDSLSPFELAVLRRLTPAWWRLDAAKPVHDPEVLTDVMHIFRGRVASVAEALKDRAEENHDRVMTEMAYVLCDTAEEALQFLYQWGEARTAAERAEAKGATVRRRRGVDGADHHDQVLGAEASSGRQPDAGLVSAVRAGLARLAAAVATLRAFQGPEFVDVQGVADRQLELIRELDDVAAAYEPCQACAAEEGKA
ncbi:MAG: hypothetical protein AB7I01_01950 [Gammaproteobacteria bacterium]